MSFFRHLPILAYKGCNKSGFGITNDEQQVVDTALREAEGDLSATLSSLEAQPPELLQKVTLAYSLADLSEDNEPIVRAI